MMDRYRAILGLLEIRFPTLFFFKKANAVFGWYIGLFVVLKPELLFQTLEVQVKIRPPTKKNK